MAVGERIQQCIKDLSEPMQAEVLRFAETLKAKLEQEQIAQEDRQWSELSLQLAMRGMEDEDSPEYSVSDLKEAFS
ncbi:MAG: hypothetical protein WD851_04275 [Pirellulales bacterium]